MHSLQLVMIHKKIQLRIINTLAFRIILADNIGFVHVGTMLRKNGAKSLGLQDLSI
jgi:hypothetical protein